MLIWYQAQRFRFRTRQANDGAWDEELSRRASVCLRVRETPLTWAEHH